MGRVGGPATRKELHVLCRADPVDHLMSMCAHHGTTFRCNGPLGDQISKCMLLLDRYSDSLLVPRLNLTVKCVASIPIEPYLEYMSDRLQRRRVEGAYIRRQTMHKRKRNKENECVWKDEALRNSVEDVLVERYSYFAFCKRCLGTED